jgi:hypothetical protein
VEISLPVGERQRLASLLVSVANLLLLMFVLAVALPLIPLKLADPFWQLSFTAAFCSNSFLALLAVLLLNLAAALQPESRRHHALQPESRRHHARRLLVRRCSGWVAIGFLLLIPLQGLAAWRALDWAGAAQSRAARQELQRIAQFRQAVVSADSVAALQVKLAAIQAPPLGSVDQSQSLAAIKSGLLAQLQAVEQRARATSGGQLAVGSGSLPGKALDPAKLLALGKDCLRVVLLSLGFAMAFAAAAQRKGTSVSLLAEGSLVAKRVVEACKFWQKERQRRETQEKRRQIRKDQNKQQLLRQNRKLQ